MKLHFIAQWFNCLAGFGSAFSTYSRSLFSCDIFQTIIIVVAVLFVDLLLFWGIYYCISISSNNSFWASSAYITRTRQLAANELSLFPDIDPRFLKPTWYLFSPQYKNSRMPKDFFKAFLGNLTYEDLIKIYLPKYFDMHVQLLPTSNETYEAIKGERNKNKWRNESWSLLGNTIQHLNANEDELHYDRQKAYKFRRLLEAMRRDYEAYLKSYGELEEWKIIDSIYNQAKRIYESAEVAVPFRSFYFELQIFAESFADAFSKYVELPISERPFIKDFIVRITLTEMSRGMEIDTSYLKPSVTTSDLFYFSLNTLTFKHHGDVVPMSGLAKITSGIQAFLSYFILAVSAALLARNFRSKT